MPTTPNIWDLIKNEQDPTLQLVINGHLYIDYLLNIFLEKKLVDRTVIKLDRMRFYDKVNLLRAIGLITVEMREYLLVFNSLRNKYAHNLKFQPDYELAYDLAKKANKANIYFKDDRIFGLGEDSKVYYPVEAILSEIIINTFQELIIISPGIFTRDDIAKLMVNQVDPPIIL